MHGLEIYSYLYSYIHPYMYNVRLAVQCWKALKLLSQLYTNKYSTFKFSFLFTLLSLPVTTPCAHSFYPLPLPLPNQFQTPPHSLFLKCNYNWLKNKNEQMSNDKDPWKYRTNIMESKKEDRETVNEKKIRTPAVYGTV